MFSGRGNTLNLEPTSVCGRDQLSLIQQQSEAIRGRELTEHGTWIGPNLINPYNNYISGQQFVPLTNQSTNTQNSYVLLSGLTCHDSNMNNQMHVGNPQPEPRFLIPCTLDENTTKVSMEDPLTKTRESSRTWIPPAQVFVENTKTVLPQISREIPSLINYHYISPETTEPLLPLRQDLTIPGFQVKNLFTSYLNTEQTLTGSTAPINQFTAMMLNNSAYLVSNQEQRKNTSLHPSQAIMQTMGRIAPHVTSQVGLDCATPVGAHTSAQIMPGFFEASNRTDNNNYTAFNVGSIDLSTHRNTALISSNDIIKSSLFDSTSNYMAGSIPTNMCSAISSSNALSSSRCDPSLPDSQISFSNVSQMFVPSPMSRATMIANAEIPSTNVPTLVYHKEPYLPAIPTAEVKLECPVPAISGDSGTWNSVPAIVQFSEVHQNQPKSLTTEQLNDLATRAVYENGALKICHICISQYPEGIDILIPPNFQSYQASDNPTCIICGRSLIN